MQRQDINQNSPRFRKILRDFEYPLKVIKDLYIILVDHYGNGGFDEQDLLEELVDDFQNLNVGNEDDEEMEVEKEEEEKIKKKISKRKSASRSQKKKYRRTNKRSMI